MIDMTRLLPRLPRLLSAVGVVVLSSVVLAACSGSDDETGGAADTPVEAEPADEAPQDDQPSVPPTTVTNPAGTAPLPDLLLQVVSFGETGSVRIVNHKNTDASVSDVWLCQADVALHLADVVDDAEIPALERANIEAADIGGLDIEGGELALYGGGGCEDPEALFGFVQWGTGGDRHVAAAANGLWPEGETVTPDPANGNIELWGDPSDPYSWS